MNKEKKIKDNCEEKVIDPSAKYVELDGKGLLCYNIELIEAAVIMLKDSLDNFKGNNLYPHCMYEVTREILNHIFDINELLIKTANEKEITKESWKECMKIFNKGE